MRSTAVSGALVALRAVCGPAILACAALGVPGSALAGIVTIAFVSDVVDGVVARRLGVATEALRRADSLVDAAFYVCATLGVALRVPSAIADHRIGIARYGRIAAYHMWSAKAWGVALWLGFSVTFTTGRAGAAFQAALVLGLLADLEGLAASLVLPTWHHDVPTLWHAMALARGERALLGSMRRRAAMLETIRDTDQGETL